MIPSTIPVQAGRIQSINLDGKQFDCIPVVIMGTQWDGERIKQTPSMILVKSEVIATALTAAAGEDIIADIATFIGCDPAELKNYWINVRAVRCYLAGNDLGSADSHDIQINSSIDQNFAYNSKADNQYNNTDWNSKWFHLNEYCENLRIDSDDWAATETFSWTVSVEIWRIAVGVESRESIALPSR